MGSEFYKNFKVVKTILRKQTKNLKLSNFKINIEGPSDKLQLTKNTQPAILTVSYSIFNVLKKEFNFDFSLF